MERMNGRMFAKMAECGFQNLSNHYQEINDLNVFPVPDGDTGTNMAATLQGGVNAANSLEDQGNLGVVAKKIADGMLLSARGNSGVILSQFFAGIAKGLKDKEEATIEEFALALAEGTKTAYKAVVKPVEGTILTVAREATQDAERKASELSDFEKLFQNMLAIMNMTLERTPELLEVLKEAGVIDSGGAGLIRIVEGMECGLLGKEVTASSSFVSPNASKGSDMSSFNADSEMEYGYCTEFILQLQNCKNGPETFVLQDLIDYFSSLGDSLVAIQNETVVKVHVHTRTPALVIEYAQRYGEFLTFKMENMSLQHNEVLLKELGKEEAKKTPIAIVSVAPSAQIGEIFRSLGVHEVVSGGQSMNPSAEDFLRAFQKANAENIIVFPNNGNIILTAQQAASLYEGSKITVIPTKSALEAYSVVPILDFENFSLEENIEMVTDAIANLVTLEVSPAIRDSMNNGVAVTKGDFIGIRGKEVVIDAKDPVEAAVGALETVPGMEDRSLITVFFGADASEVQREVLLAELGEKYSMIDVNPVEGEQTIYPFLIAVQ